MWKLMDDGAISKDDREALAEFFLTSPKFSQGEKVRQFENKWSEWQGCKYSVFVNSGSSANLMAVYAMRLMYGLGKWGAQSCTWATNVSPLIQLNPDCSVGLCDIDLKNFGVCMDSMRKVNPNFYFITHLLGFPAVTEEFLSYCAENNILFIEDCCEAHGATYKGKKVGNFGICSTFSFYYGHHMTTIEGGMICTDREEVYHLLLLLRSHGLLRELPEPYRTDRQIANLDKQFTFLTNGFNFRNMEANALLGIRQLENLDKHNDQRNRNYKVFAENIDKNKYLCDFDTTGISSFCLPIFAKTVDIVDVRAKLVEIGIEHRPCVGGNLARHPMVKGRSVFNLENCIKSDVVADQCVYVGNHQAVDENMVYDLCKKLNEV